MTDDKGDSLLEGGRLFVPVASRGQSSGIDAYELQKFLKALFNSTHLTSTVSPVIFKNLYSAVSCAFLCIYCAP